ncbi:MAG: family 20 glycosylhydrolase [Bacteroidales bacterium]
MKNKFIPITIIGLFLSIISFCQNPINIIPQPVSVKINKSSPFTFNNNTKIIANPNSKEYSVAEYLQSKLRDYNQDIKPVIPMIVNPKYNVANSIIFVLSSDKILGKEGYQMDILSDKIIILANENNGFFYGAQTLIQIIMTAEKDKTNSSILIPTSQIIDYPRFAYRGKHLDCSRHFFSTQEIKDYIDILAFHKLNTFHWHLTDDQGWRIEIKKYPKLHEVGGKRKETLVGHYSDNFPQIFDGKEYSGYYSQEEIKDIVKYAQERYIDIIPEIEMPGHAIAALSAYPEFSCTGNIKEPTTTWGVFDDVFCTKDETFIFLQDILDEVIELFPSPYIHIGGDECPKVRWKECPKCQEVIKNNNLKDEQALQSYFTKRIENYLKTKGRRTIGWDEILEGEDVDDAIIMSWQGESGGIDAAKLGHDAIMTPSAYLYFNNYQGVADQEPLAIGGFTTLKKVYDYEPVPSELNKEEVKNIMGVQACTWTEYIPTYEKLQYMDLPRLSALSEIAWTKKENKDYEDFLNRIESQLDRYNILGYNYATSHYAVKSSTHWNNKKKQVELTLSSPMKNANIFYSTNLEEPSLKTNKYTKPIILKGPTTIKARAIRKKKNSGNNERKLQSPLFQQKYTINKTTGKEYKIKNINPQYSGTSKYTLTDGIFGTRQTYDRWVGTLGNDYIVELDLNQTTSIQNIAINFLDQIDSWIFAPTQVDFYISQDGKEYKKVNTIYTKDIKPNNSIYTFNSKIENEIGKTRCENIPKYVTKEITNVRYIKIEAKAIKTCPEGHSGYGYKAHCFADEITVE